MITNNIIFLDTEVGLDDNRIHDIGAVKPDGNVFHSSSVRDFCAFLEGAEYVCGHNIVHFDLKYLSAAGADIGAKVIDTLYLSPLLFPKRPYHALLKNDKLQVDELNNPVNDSQKAEMLFYDEVNAFFALPARKKQIFCCLLYRFQEFRGFFDYVRFALC